MAQNYSTNAPRTNAYAVAKLLKVYQPLMHISKFAGQNAQMVDKNQTDTIKFRRYLNLPDNVTPLTEGTNSFSGAEADNYLDQDSEDFTVALIQFGGWTALSDKALWLHEDPLLEVALEKIGEQGARTLERVNWAVLRAATSIVYANGTTLAGINSVLTRDSFVAAVEFLESNDAPKISSVLSASVKIGTTPIREAYFGFCNPILRSDFERMNDTSLNSQQYYVSAEKYATGDQMPGELGQVYGVRLIGSTLYEKRAGAGAVITTEEVATTTVGADDRADVYDVVIVAKDAYTTVALKGMDAVKVMVSGDGATSADPLGTTKTIGWKTFYNIVITNPLNIIRILTAHGV